MRNQWSAKKRSCCARMAAVYAAGWFGVMGVGVTWDA
jgi:hypothetical protein